MKALLSKRGKLHSHTGIDYLVFPRGLFGELPPFAVGRPGWDNWLLYHARSENIPIIDISKIVNLVHQNHDYSHHPSGEDGVWTGEEARYNWDIVGGYEYGCSLKDANLLLTQKGLKLNLSPYYFYRRLVILSSRYAFLKPLVKMIRVGRKSPSPFY